MVFPSANSTFGSITTMVIGRDQLEINVISFHKILEELRTFVVQYLDLRFEAGFDELGENGLVRSFDGFSRA